MARRRSRNQAAAAAAGAGVAAEAALPAISAGLMALTGAIGLGSKIFGASRADAERKKQIQQQQRALEQQQRIQKFAEIRAQAQSKQDLAFQLSMQRRNEQKSAMMAIGGIAAGVSILFLMAAMRKKKPKAGA